jgi:hypothetical protein
MEALRISAFALAMGSAVRTYIPPRRAEQTRQTAVRHRAILVRFDLAAIFYALPYFF